jgi:hypothetical protein
MRTARLLPVLALAATAALSFAPSNTFAPSSTASPPDPETALREGNRLFHEGDFEGAMAAYAAGWERTDGTDPVLAYNLGTTAHHLERLPEALLWYRRAEAARGGADPWLSENLELVRAQLDASNTDVVSQRTSGGWGFWMGTLMDRRRQLALLGAVLAWGVLPALFLTRSPRARRAAVAVVAVLAGLPFLGALLVDLLGPRAAVLLRDCPGPGGGLVAGSEVRVFPEPDGRWRVPEGGGDSLVCPAEVIGLVDSADPAFRFRGISAIVFGPATVESRSWSGVAMGTQNSRVVPVHRRATVA